LVRQIDVSLTSSRCKLTVKSLRLITVLSVRDAREARATDAASIGPGFTTGQPVGSLDIAGRASETQRFRKLVTLARSADIPDNVTSGRVTEGLHIADLDNDGSLRPSVSAMLASWRLSFSSRAPAAG
jgi:hypothetical protein